MGVLTLLTYNLLYLDNYKSLWDKYHDKYRETYKNVRTWVYNNYDEYFRRAWKEHDFRQLIAMRRAKKEGDYIQLYNLMIDMDGDLDGQIII